MMMIMTIMTMMTEETVTAEEFVSEWLVLITLLITPSSEITITTTLLITPSVNSSID